MSGAGRVTHVIEQQFSNPEALSLNHSSTEINASFPCDKMILEKNISVTSCQWRGYDMLLLSFHSIYHKLSNGVRGDMMKLERLFTSRVLYKNKWVNEMRGIIQDIRSTLCKTIKSLRKRKDWEVITIEGNQPIGWSDKCI
jgi:hypothetical protein